MNYKQTVKVSCSFRDDWTKVQSQGSKLTGRKSDGKGKE